MKDKAALIAKIAKNEEERLLLSLIADRADHAENRSVLTTTPFLSEHEQAIAAALLNSALVRSYVLLGGIPEAERKVIVFYPDYYEESDIDGASAGLSCVRVEKSRFDREKVLNHRDYLGSLLGLGIKRELTGDIVVTETGADIVVKEEIVRFLTESVCKVGSLTVTCTEIPLSGCREKKQEYEEISDTLASLRLDAGVSAGFRVRRESAAEAIRCGKVEVNGMTVEKPDAEFHEGDRISLRGGGKLVVSEVGGLSKKGRIRVTFHKFR